MLRISRLTDYATVILAALAQAPGRVQTSAALAEQTRLSLPTVSKVLKQLQRSGLVASTRGLRGGYQLGRPATEISAGEILDALEGPLALTDCASAHSQCGLERTCNVGHAWQRLNVIIRRSLHEVSLAELAGIETQPRVLALERDMKAAAARPARKPFSSTP